MMLKKMFIFLLSMSLVVGLMAACSSGGGSSSPAPEVSGSAPAAAESPASQNGTPAQAGKVTVWTWDDNYNIPIMKTAAGYYAEKNPNVMVDVISLAKEDVYNKLQTGLAAGGTGLPDIAMLEDYVSGKFLETFYGGFADLSGKIDYSNFLDFKIDAISFEGIPYGVPLDTGASTLFYRLDLVEAAGYTADDMQNLTWEKFIEIGKAVKEKTNTYMIVEMANNKTTLIRNMMQSAGLWYFDKSGAITIKDNAAIKEAFTLIKTMKDANILFEAESTGDRAGALNKGTVASIVNGPWMGATLKAAPEQSGQWRVAATPRFSNVPGAVNASNLGGSSWYVMEASPNKDMAIDLLETVFAHNTDFYNEILLNQSCVSGFKPALSGEIFETEDEFFGGQKVYKEYAATLEKVPGVNYGGYVAEANDAVSAGLSGYMSGSLTVEQALEQAEDQLKNQLGR